jgi:hypothetical protein
MDQAQRPPKMRQIFTIQKYTYTLCRLNASDQKDAAGALLHAIGASGEAGEAIFLPAEELARHLLGVLLGIRVPARVRPDRALLEGVVHPAIELLDPNSRRALGAN